MRRSSRSSPASASGAIRRSFIRDPAAGRRSGHHRTQGGAHDLFTGETGRIDRGHSPIGLVRREAEGGEGGDRFSDRVLGYVRSGTGAGREAVAKLEQEARRRLLADAGDPGETGRVPPPARTGRGRPRRGRRAGRGRPCRRSRSPRSNRRNVSRSARRANPYRHGASSRTAWWVCSTTVSPTGGRE